jgi:hypothetical protein
MMVRSGVVEFSFVVAAFRALIVATSLALAACAGAQKASTLPAPLAMPSVVTDTTYLDALHAFRQLPEDTPERALLRARLSHYLIERCDRAISQDSYDGVVRCLAEIAELYTPSEYVHAGLPQGLERAACYLVRKGSPRGDEGRVLSGLLIESLLHPGDAAAAERYRRLLDWGFDVRAGMNGPLDRFEGLVQAWEEHARLSPTPEVIAMLARLHREERDAVVQLSQPHERRVPPSAAAF